MGNTSVRRGEIHYISKNVTVGSKQNAGRPAIIVSNDIQNMHSPVYIVVYLTTQPKKELPTHALINSTGVPSTALCESVDSVSYERVMKYVATCTDEEMQAVDNCLKIALALDDTDLLHCDTRLRTRGFQYDDNKLPPPKNEASEELTELRIERNMYKSMYEKLLEKMLER